MLQHARAHHRTQRERHEARDDHGARQRPRELGEQPAGGARHEADRRIDGRQRQRHGDDGEADLLAALEGGRHRRHAFLDVAVDVLEHDDRVVDHEADRQHHGQQRQRVHREARAAYMIANAPSSEAGMVTTGMSVARTLRRKTEHHDDDQQDRFADGAKHGVDRRLDEDRGVVRDLGLHALGQDWSTMEGNSARTPLEMSSGLATACLTTPIATAGLPVEAHRDPLIQRAALRSRRHRASAPDSRRPA